MSPNQDCLIGHLESGLRFSTGSGQARDGFGIIEFQTVVVPGCRFRQLSRYLQFPR